MHRTDMVERHNQLTQGVLRPPPACYGAHTHTHTNTFTHINKWINIFELGMMAQTFNPVCGREKNVNLFKLTILIQIIVLTRWDFLSSFALFP